MGLVRSCAVLAAVLAVLFAPASARAASGPLDVATVGTSISLSRLVTVLEDCTGSLGIADVRAPALSGRFVEPTGRSLNFGYSSCTYWLKLDVRDSGAAPRSWLLVMENPRVDVVELYDPPSDGPQRSGSLVPMAQRMVQSRHPAFALGPLSSEAHPIYLRARTTDVATFPLTLIERDSFVTSDHREQLVLGIYYGIMLFAALFNAFVFAYTKEATYLLYVALIVSYGLFQAAVNGVDIEYFWPSRPQWNMTAIPIFCGLSLVSVSAFAWKFLSLSRYAPGLRRLLYAALAAGALIILAAAVGRITLAGLLGSVLSPLTVTLLGVMGVVALVRGCRHARYFLLAGTLQFLGVVVNGLRNLAVLPATFATTYGNQIGASLFVLLLSLALMARLNLMEREATEQARQAAEAKLQALQAKINPHFLFNTLNTIAGLISEAPERAEGVVLKLSKLFRYTLTATEKDRVLLTEELAIVRSYLEIEQARFGDRLTFEIRTEGDLDGVSLPGLTLQPLVENSVKHGLRPKVEGGRVEVLARMQPDACHLSVVDDGVGMDVQAQRSGHGLASVRERLRLAYGTDFEMKLSSESGLRIDIRLPVRREA